MLGFLFDCHAIASARRVAAAGPLPSTVVVLYSVCGSAFAFFALGAPSFPALAPVRLGGFRLAAAVRSLLHSDTPSSSSSFVPASSTAFRGLRGNPF